MPGSVEEAEGIRMSKIAGEINAEMMNKKPMDLVMRKQSEQAMDCINRMGLEGSPMREDK